MRLADTRLTRFWNGEVGLYVFLAGVFLFILAGVAVGTMLENREREAWQRDCVDNKGGYYVEDKCYQMNTNNVVSILEDW